jgi:DNA polymerase III delta prime subunit
MAGPELARPALVERVLARVPQAGPLLLAGPPGAGKTTLLLETAHALSARGWIPIYLDLMGAASSPERFTVAALDALPAESFGALLGRATQIRRLAEPGGDGAAAVQALLSLWAALADAGGRPVALLLDEPTEIRSLAYFAGLREVATSLGEALRRRARGTVLASSYPTQARTLWPAFETMELPPLSAAELEWALAPLGLGGRAGALLRASFGWPRYARVLAERLAQGDDLETAWAEEMAMGGRLESAARHTYEALLLRSRGYGMSKAVLAAVAEEEGTNLTALVGRLGRSPGAIRDYLGWLLDVDALRADKKRYYYVDGLVREWVRLHARGQPATANELREAAHATLAAAATPEAAAALSAEPEAEPVTARRDHLMEID